MRLLIPPFSAATFSTFGSCIIADFLRSPRGNATLKAQLATPAETVPAGDDWLHEIKFDGYRMIAHIRRRAARFYTRRANDWIDRFPELAALLPNLSVDKAIVDGEIAHMLPSGITHFGAPQDDIAGKRTGGLVYRRSPCGSAWRPSDARSPWAARWYPLPP